MIYGSCDGMESSLVASLMVVLSVTIRGSRALSVFFPVKNRGETIKGDRELISEFVIDEFTSRYRHTIGCQLVESRLRL